jgi:integral membrane protein
MLPAGVLRFDTPPARLRAVAFIEGLSYLVLLGIAMPLKYFAGMPMAVRVAGSLHGLLFVLLMLAIAEGWRRRGKSFGWAVRLGFLSLLPFGTFLADRELAHDDEQFRARRGRA